jgi:hypothetical protein
MGTPEQPSRSGLLGLLAGIVVVVGAASWLVTARIGTHGAPRTSLSPKATAVPTPPDCGSGALSVLGGFAECATVATDVASICTLSSQGLEDLLRFVGYSQDFELDIEIDGDFHGQDKYNLRPWPHGMGTPDGVPKVQVDEFSTETTWQSVSGVLTVTSSAGLSGTLSATLQAPPGVSAVPGAPRPTLSVSGPWRCPSQS